MSLSWGMDGQWTVILPQMEWGTDTCYNTDELLNIILSERSQTDTLMIPFIWNIQERYSPKEGKHISGFQGLCGGKFLGFFLMAKGYGLSFWGDEDVLWLDSGDGYTTLWLS